MLAEREASAISRYGHDLQEASKRRAVEESFGLYRRLIRTARTDYPDALPKRNYQPIRLAPTDGDVERARATRVLSRRRARPATLISAVKHCCKSPDAALQSLTRTVEHPPTGTRRPPNRLAPDRHLSSQEPGDAKLDALIDHLRIFHAKKSDGRAVVVVAEDNPTTDYLRDAIEKLTDMKVAKKRRTVGAAEELEVQVALLKEALDDFISGEAKILVAADAAPRGPQSPVRGRDNILRGTLVAARYPAVDRPYRPSWHQGLASNRRIVITPIVVESSIESQILDSARRHRCVSAERGL